MRLCYRELLSHSMPPSITCSERRTEWQSNNVRRLILITCGSLNISNFADVAEPGDGPTAHQTSSSSNNQVLRIGHESSQADYERIVSYYGLPFNNID